MLFLAEVPSASPPATRKALFVQITLTNGRFLTSLDPMQLLLKSFALFAGLAFATPALAFSYSCADWKAPLFRAGFWKEATRATIADCVQDMGFAMGFSVNDRDDEGATPLFYAAAFASNSDVIIALFEAGADVYARNESGWTPLHGAALVNSNPDVITALLQAGADVNARDEYGSTPLHEAAGLNSYPRVITALIGAGADVDARDEYGSTPLHEAAAMNEIPNVISALIEAGADVNARDEDGRTPLHYAALMNSNPDVITTQITAGADGSIEDDNGKTPFDLAKENEAIKNTEAYWALNDARFNKGVQPPLVVPSESSSVPIFEPHMIGGDIDALITAVRACWLVEPGAEWARVVVTVGFSLGQDGRVIGDVRMINASGGNDAQTATAFQAARRAILRCQRSGYNLPPEKYQSWQNIEMTFDASNMWLR